MFDICTDKVANFLCENKSMKPLKFSTNYTHEDMMIRVKMNEGNLEIVKYTLINFFGGGFTNAELINIAVYISNGIGIKVDRMAKRNRDALLCWFSENWGLIYPILTKSKLLLLNHTKMNKNCNLPNQMQKETVTHKPYDVLQLLNQHH